MFIFSSSLFLSPLGWHTLPSHASAEACLTGWPNMQPQGTDQCSVALHHEANLMVCVVCSCCATSPYREVCRAKGGIGSGETMYHDIYPARPITTVSLAANTYCIDGWPQLMRTSHPGPRSNLAVRVNRAIDDWLVHAAGGHLLSVVQATTNTERL